MGGCKSAILNSDVLCVYDNLSNILDSGASRIRLDFYSETEHEIFEILTAFQEKISKTADSQQNPIIEQMKQRGFTKGHYFRGIE